MKISMGEFRNLSESSMGYCEVCSDFTRECTEPDAMDYECPVCDNPSVTGIENALLMDLIQVSE